MKHKSWHCQPIDDISNYETRCAHQGNSHRWRRVEVQDTEPWDPRTFSDQKEEKPRQENEKEWTVK